MQTTDLHMHVLPYDYYADRASHGVGLARTAALIAAMRAGAQNSLLFDTGDFLQGSPLGDYMAREGAPAGAGPHPAVAAMNVLRYDAGTIGNHDFNYGLPFLSASLSQAAFPFVSANALDAGGRSIWPAYVMLDRSLRDGAGEGLPIRIGVIGFLPPQTALWDRDKLAGRVVTADIIETARRCLPQMRAEGADLVVALCHSGIGPAEPYPGMENAATALAALPGVDVVLAGHTHQIFPSPEPPPGAAIPGVDARHGTLCGKPAVMAGCFGSHLGVIDLLLEREDGRWRLCAAQSRAEPITLRDPEGTSRARVRSRREVAAVAQAPHRATRAYLNQRLGRCTLPLTTHFALLGDSAATALVAAAKRDFVTEALAGGAWGGLPVLATATPFKAGGRAGPGGFVDIPAGPLAKRHVAELYPFPNEIRALLLSHAQLLCLLDHGTAVYARLRPGQTDQPLLDPSVPGYSFDTLLGASFRVDLSMPAAPARPSGDPWRGPGRVSDLRVDGRPTGAGDRFIVATSSYRAAVLGELLRADPPQEIPLPYLRIPDILARWIIGAGTVTPPPSPQVILDLPPGATALFETAPQARPDSLDLPALSLTSCGRADSGFQILRLAPRPAG